MADEVERMSYHLAHCKECRLIVAEMLITRPKVPAGIDDHEIPDVDDDEPGLFG